MNAHNSYLTSTYIAPLDAEIETAHAALLAIDPVSSLASRLSAPRARRPGGLGQVVRSDLCFRLGRRARARLQPALAIRPPWPGREDRLADPAQPGRHRPDGAFDRDPRRGQRYRGGEAHHGRLADRRDDHARARKGLVPRPRRLRGRPVRCRAVPEADRAECGGIEAVQSQPKARPRGPSRGGVASMW
jgi:hypothetical protein